MLKDPKMRSGRLSLATRLAVVGAALVCGLLIAGLRGQGPAVPGMTGSTAAAAEAATPAAEAKIEATAGEKKPEPTLVGGWRADSVSTAMADGQRRTFFGGEGTVSVVVSEKMFTMRVGDKVLTDMSWTANPKQSPPTIDLKSAEGAMLGIYNLDGARLRVALNDASQGRPKDIRQESAGLFLVLKRIPGGPLWMINADGTGLRQFFATPEGAECYSPAWSPDGDKVAFDAARPLLGESRYNARIMVIDMAGGAPSVLAPGIRPSWSPDGKRIVFESHDPAKTGVCTMNADGTDIRQIDPGGSHPAWSPMGAVLAYMVDDENGGNICIHDLKTGQRRLLFEKEYGPVQEWFGLDWSPDAQWICYWLDMRIAEPGEGRTHVAIVNIEGKKKGFRPLYHTDPWSKVTGFSNCYAWRPKQGKQILAALVTADNPNKHLYLVDRENKAPPQLIPGQDPNLACGDGTWSPAGQRIIFTVRPGAQVQAAAAYAPAATTDSP